MELQILDSNKKVNKSLVDRASNFVWTHEDEEPDYLRLKEHLSQFWEKIEVSQPKKISKSTLQKLKKLKRKKGKIRRGKKKL